MKKAVLFVLLAALCLSVCACAAPETPKLRIGDTARTDSFAFNLHSVEYETPPLSTTTTMKLAFNITYTGEGSVMWDPESGMIFSSEAGTQSVGGQYVRFAENDTFTLKIKSYSYSGVTFTPFEGGALALDAEKSPTLHIRATTVVPQEILYRIDPLVLVLSLPVKPDAADVESFLFGARAGSTGGGVGTYAVD